MSLYRKFYILNFFVFSSVFLLKASPEDFPASMASGTIPVIYINTEDNQEIIDKTTPISAGFYLKSFSSEHSDIGTEENPVETTIRGRGNYTWLQVKKPYKLKFKDKISLCGLPKSKHYALMAHIVLTSHVWADNEMAFEMARMMGMAWAPHTVPVELVLNGEYLGVYFLSETVRIEKNRLNIFEQEDLETDPSLVPYGWLIEIDNSGADFVIPENKNINLNFTFHTPEVLSDEQWDFITNELQSITDAIYDSEDPDKWTEYFDSKSLARYFIIREILHDSDAYAGSFYFYKDKGEDTKWHFGPLWDCTNQSTDKDCYIPHTIIEHPEHKIRWMSRLILSPAFEKALREEWSAFYNEDNLQKIMTHLESYSQNLDEAFKASNLRWRGENVQLYNRKAHLEILRTALYNNTKWINNHLNINEIARTFNETHSVNSIISNDEETIYYRLDGIPLNSKPTTPGLYIYRKGKETGKIIVK